MEDIMFDEISKMIENDDVCKISDVDSYEKSYDYYEVYCTINGEYYRVLDTRNSRCSDLVFTDSQHQRNHAEWIIKKLKGWGGLDEKEVEVKESWNHNPSSWDDDEPYGDEIGYIGDGLDCCDELNYYP